MKERSAPAKRVGASRRPATKVPVNREAEDDLDRAIRVADPDRALTPQSPLQLQRSAGNRAVTGLVGRPAPAAATAGVIQRNAGLVATWVSTNDYFTSDFGGSREVKGNDVYVPRGSAYPHIHIGKDFIVYSRGKSDHVYLVAAGNDVRMNKINEVKGSVGQPDIEQVLRYMSSQL